MLLNIKRTKMKKGILLSCFTLFCFYIGASQNIERVEPPFWWTGMNNDTLQIMIYGDQISTLNPKVKSKYNELLDVQKVDSENYLFLTMLLSNHEKNDGFDIGFYQGKKLSFKHRYELMSRRAGSADRKGFDNSDVMYLITPDRFSNGDVTNDEVEGMKEGIDRSDESGRHGGDLKGIENHLDYIKDLGFSMIWLNPVLENNQDKWSYHGYSTTDYYKVDPRFGSNEEYVSLSKKGKEKGIGMIMDIIVNHCGSDHWWMNDLPCHDWINYQSEPYQETNHKKETLLDPYRAEVDREQMTKGWFVPTMPDLNQRNPLMSKYLIQNTIWWIEYADLSGVRQDTYSYPFREFMTDWTCAIMDEYPNFNIVGEEWVLNPSIIAYWQKDKINQDGYTSCLPSLMDFPLTMNLQAALTEEESWNSGLIKLYGSLANDFVYADPNQLVIFPDNHDMSRIFTQLNEDFDLYKMAIGFYLTTRGIPQIYYGTEILMSHPDSDSHGSIRTDFPGGWKNDSFELTHQQLEARDYLISLLKWRAETNVIHTGQLLHYAPENGVYVYFRLSSDEKVMVVMNKNKMSIEMNLDRFEQALQDVSYGYEVITKKEIQLDSIINLKSKSILILELH